LLWTGQSFWLSPTRGREARGGKGNPCAIGNAIGDRELKQVTKRKRNLDVSLARHEAKCGICAHPHREEIERAFVDWTSPTKIARAYKLSRDSIYRHAWAIGLLQKRQKNVRSALEKIIERAGEVKVNAAAVVSAVQAYAKINAQGQWIDRSETDNLSKLFDRMTRDELEAYARDGTLPRWFPVQSQQEGKQDAP